MYMTKRDFKRMYENETSIEFMKEQHDRAIKRVALVREQYGDEELRANMLEARADLEEIDNRLIELVAERN